MDIKTSTYEHLFSLLKSLGFDEGSRAPSLDSPRVFCHAETDTVLAFGRNESETVTAADLLSADVHLHGKEIVDQPLESLLQAQGRWPLTRPNREPLSRLSPSCAKRQLHWVTICCKLAEWNL